MIVRFLGWLARFVSDFGIDISDEVNAIHYKLDKLSIDPHYKKLPMPSNLTDTERKII